MNAITQAILDKSKFVVDLIKINQATKDSFHMSIQGKVTKIGITTAHMSAMTVDMVGPQGAFGRLDIPPNKIGATGGEVNIDDQVIRITDMEAFKAFVRSILQDEELVLRLENGQATLKALGRTADIVYKKDVHLRGLKSLQMKVIETEKEAQEDAFRTTVALENPSPFEIDLGTVLYEVHGDDGATIAQQKGATYVGRGKSKLTVTGSITGTTSKAQVRFVGADVEEDTWFKEIIRVVDMTVTIPNDSKVWRAH